MLLLLNLLKKQAVMQRENTVIDLYLCDETSLNSEKENNAKHKLYKKKKCCVFQLNCTEKSYFYILYIQQ